MVSAVPRGPSSRRERQAALEHLARQHALPFVARQLHRRAQRPQRAARAVLRRRRSADERAVVAHEVPEPAVGGLRRVQEARGTSRPAASSPRELLRPIGVQRDDQRARVVVDAIAALARGHAEGRVLDDAGVVGHAQQVVEAQLREAAGARRVRGGEPRAGAARRSVAPRLRYCAPTRGQVNARVYS